LRVASIAKTQHRKTMAQITQTRTAADRRNRVFATERFRSMFRRKRRKRQAACSALNHSARQLRTTVQHELSVLALIKGSERYVYVYDDASRERLLDVIRDQAASPRLSLSWFDAAVLKERAIQQSAEIAADPLSRNRG
jgi:hypothetical protein